MNCYDCLHRRVLAIEEAVVCVIISRDLAMLIAHYSDESCYKKKYLEQKQQLLSLDDIDPGLEIMTLLYETAGFDGLPPHCNCWNRGFTGCDSFCAGGKPIPFRLPTVKLAPHKVFPSRYRG